MYVLIFFQLTSKADMKVVQITLIRVTYSLKMPQIAKLGRRSKKYNNKYLTFNTSFNVCCPFEMT